jgi:glycogen phosphorylase/synthase
MSEQKIKPDYLFEVSWEVCNKVGGIYTVLASKYTSVKGDYGNKYIFIGPDVWKETRENPDFIEDKSLFHQWVAHTEKEDLRVRTGHWNIPGKPVAVLVDFTTYFALKDKILSRFWESYKLDSLSGGWDYIEPALFGYAAGKVIESFSNFYLNSGEKLIGHFHEWMTGAGILYLKEYAPQIGTVFTTHATSLGRSMAGHNLPLYSGLGQINPDETARNLGIISKHSLERISAIEADSFATVSEITAVECAHFLDRHPDVVTPNGFSAFHEMDGKPKTKERIKSRETILRVATGVFNQKLPEDTLITITSGRYEFLNKGLDAFIDALGKLNREDKLKRNVLAVIAVPANHSGPRKEVAKRIEEPDYNYPLTGEHLTHSLYDSANDPVIKRIHQNELTNSPDCKVKILFVPVYLDAHDGIFNIDYYAFLSGCDLSAFPSFYEPWGYTPLESIAFGIPTITTTLAGFGVWVKNYYDTPYHSVSVIERTENNYIPFVEQIFDRLRYFANCTDEELKKSQEESLVIAEKLEWKHLSENYNELYAVALNKLDSRSGSYKRRASLEYPVQKNGTYDKPEWKKIFVKSTIPPELEPLIQLSMNLWWTWNHETAELFASMDDKLWTETDHNPVAVLNRLSFDRLNELKGDSGFISRMKKIHADFEAYMDEKKNMPENKVAYFSMEFGLHESLKIYSGGLGVLAGDFLKQASDSNKNITGIGLLYRYGYFTQSISIFGDQIAESRPHKYTDLPLIPVRNENGDWVHIMLALPGRTLMAKVWKVCIGRVDLYLLDTDIEGNTSEDKAITHHLYGGDWHNRFKQELLLGVGGVRLLRAINKKPDIYHLNEGHAAFAGLERLRQLVESRGIGVLAAIEVVRASSLFTTHTPVPAGHDTFSEDTLRTYIPHYADRLNMSWNEFMNLGRYRKNVPDEKFSMSVLAANLSQEMNGVSKIHGRVSREMFAGLYPGYFPEELHISHVTNGVHYPTWTTRHWQNFHLSKLGDMIGENQSNPDLWNKITGVSDEVIWKQRLRAKNDFLGFLRQKMEFDLTNRQESPGIITKTLNGINDDALYFGFARRFATYKRAHLLFTNLDILEELVSREDQPLRFVFAGKAHPNDKPGQDMIKRIIEISKMPAFIGKIFFLENYDMHVARYLVSGVDIWLNTPTRPMEASGTSGEKAVMNSVLNLSVLDGWWAEGYIPKAGWAIQEAKTYANQAFQDELDARIIYRLIGDEILPLYFDRDKQEYPHKWIGYLKNNISGIVPHFTMKRMLDDYYEKFYTKLFERTTKVRDENLKLAFEMEAWKKGILEKWNGIEVISVRIPDSNTRPLDQGEHFEVELLIGTNGIDPANLGIEIVFGQKVMDKVNEIYKMYDLELLRSDGSKATYSCSINLVDAGVFDFAFRMYPVHENLPHRQDFPLLKWI